MTEEKERRGCALTLASHATCSDHCLTSASNFGTKNSDNRKQMITEETVIRQTVHFSTNKLERNHF